MKRVLIMLAAEADLSMDEQRQRLSAALREQFGCDDDGCQRFWIYETFNEYLIARGPENALYRIPYTWTGDDVTLGEAQEVTTAYVPVAESCEFNAAEADGAVVEGKYPITALKAGWARGSLGGQAVPHYYPPAFVKLVAEALHGKPFGRRHPDQLGPDPTGATDPERIAGWLDGGTFVGDRAVTTINLFAAESDLRSRLDDARKNNKLSLFGVSMLASIGLRPGVIEGKQCLVAESLGTLYSVDLCARGGAGGEFLVANSAVGADISARQSAAINPTSTAIAPLARGAQPGGASASRTGATTMKDSLRKLLEALRTKNAARAAELSLKFATVAEAEYPALMTEVTDALTAADPTQQTLAAEAATALAEAKRIQSRSRIEASLTASKLSEPAKKLARTHLETALVAEADLSQEKIDAEISATREAFAAYEQVGRVRAGAVAGLDSVDKMALAMEAAIGVKASMGKGVPAFKGLREAYVVITGDRDLSRLSAGGFTGHVLASEAVATADFPNLLLNSMTKRLLQDYAELSIDGLSMLYTKATINDYKLQDRVREGYFGELATVNENGTYTEIGKPTDERVSYSVAKRGHLLTVSEETIRNDDLGAIARFPSRLARAGRWTLKSYITNFFATNPAYQADTVAWFHANHYNLGSAALSQDSLIVAEVNLLTQKEKDSNEPLGLTLDWLMVPPQLAATARQINQCNTAGSNAFFQRFGANNERIIVNEKLTDANDWYYGTSQQNAPCLEIGFLDGIEEPQIFLANQATVGTQFTADQLQYKVKMVFNGAIIDFRGVGKNVVP